MTFDTSAGTEQTILQVQSEYSPLLSSLSDPAVYLLFILTARSYGSDYHPPTNQLISSRFERSTSHMYKATCDLVINVEPTAYNNSSNLGIVQNSLVAKPVYLLFI